MRGFSFDTFEINPKNREAVEACRAVASMLYDEQRPVILLGAESTGKSHLLWAIVKQVRSSALRTGLALVMPHEFPPKVRDLIRDPAPIQQGKRAILLVDELDRFRENLDALEGVVQVFLENNHEVVIASSVHPDRLPQLSETFKAILATGRLLPLPSRNELNDADTAQVDALAPMKQALSAVQAERDALEAQLAEKAQQLAALPDLQAELEQAHLEQERLRSRIAPEQANEAPQTPPGPTPQALHDRASALEIERDQLRAERDALEKRLAEKAADSSGYQTMREQLEQAQQEAGSALAEQARLQGLLSATEGLDVALAEAQEENSALRDRLQGQEEALQAILAQAREDQDSFMNRQQALGVRLQELESLLEGVATQKMVIASGFQPIESQATSTPAEKEGLEAEQKELQALLEEARFDNDRIREEAQQTIMRLEDELADARSLVTAFEEQLESERQKAVVDLESVQEENEELNGLLEESRAEQGRLNVTLDQSRGRLAVIESELKKARHQSTVQLAEMDALRHTAAAQVASATMQAGEMELRISQLETALEAVRQAGRTTQAEASMLSEELIRAAEMLQQVARSQHLATQLPEEDQESAQVDLFDAERDPTQQAKAPDAASPKNEEKRSKTMLNSMNAVLDQVFQDQDASRDLSLPAVINTLSPFAQVACTPSPETISELKELQSIAEGLEAHEQQKQDAQENPAEENPQPEIPPEESEETPA